jgi:hypothetical protein
VTGFRKATFTNLRFRKATLRAAQGMKVAFLNLGRRAGRVALVSPEGRRGRR